MITVVIPCLNEARTVFDLIRLVLRHPAVSQVLVIDDGSIDDTVSRATAAGAEVLTSSIMGKGASMRDGVKAARNGLVAFMDGDLKGLEPDFLERLVAPLLADEADFVKADFERASGRVTVLTARPLLQAFFPELTHIGQPLGGIIAARRELLAQLDFEDDYGVDVGLLLDCWFQDARVVQVHIGGLDHESQSLARLGEMASQVVRAILERAHAWGRLHGAQLQAMREVDRHSAAAMDRWIGRLGDVPKLALFDMDGTLIDGRFVELLAKRCGVSEALAIHLDRHDVDAIERSRAIAAVFKGVPRERFEAVAREAPLFPDAAETVMALKRSGFTVGIVTDSYFVASEIVRRRVFADFSVANLLHFKAGRCTGEFVAGEAFSHPDGCAEHRSCKWNAMRHLVDRLGIDARRVIAVGDGLNDVCMLREASASFAYRPKHDLVRAAAQVVLDELSQVLDFVSGGAADGGLSIPRPSGGR